MKMLPIIEIWLSATFSYKTNDSQQEGIIIFKWLHEKILSFNGFFAFNSMNIMLVVLTHKYPIFTLLMIISTSYSIYAAFILSWRVFKSIKGLKDLQYFYINSYFNDLLHRKSIIHNAIKLLIGCFLLVSTLLVGVEVIFNRPSILNDNDVTLPFLFLVAFAFILIIRLSHSKVSPVLMILVSTFLGLMILIISFMVLLLIITSLLAFSMKFLETGTPPSFTSAEFRGFIDNLIHVGVGFIFIASDRSYFLSNLLVSIFIQVLIIGITPPYFFKRSKNAFTFVNYIFNALILLLLFVSQDVSNSINTFVIGFDAKGFEEFLNLTNSNTFKELFDKFINVTLMPYIIGSFIGLLLLDRKEEALQKKARNSYLTALHLHNIENVEDVVILLKKSVYYGGESYELLIRSNNDFIAYNNSLLTDESVSTSWGHRVTKFIGTAFNRLLSALQIIIYFSKSIPSRISKLPIVLQQFADNYNLRTQMIILSIAFSGFAVFALLDFISINREINTMFRLLKILFNSLSIAFPTLFLIATASYLYYRKRLHIAVFYFIASVFLITVLTFDYFLIKILIGSLKL